MSTRRRPWSRAEQLITLRYYLQADFGRLHSRNPEIQALADALGRTASSIAMKGSNYASLDPNITGSGRKGLAKASRQDQEIWSLMNESFEDFEEESAAAAIQFRLNPVTLLAADPHTPSLHTEQTQPEHDEAEETETVSIVTTRRKQSLFRSAVLTAYRNACSITGIAVPELLNASHIIPWSANSERRLDPTNGIALNALHDRAFDRGLISFDHEFKVLISSRLQNATMPAPSRALLISVEGIRALPPLRFDPDPNALEYHRDTIFIP